MNLCFEVTLREPDLPDGILQLVREVVTREYLCAPRVGEVVDIAAQGPGTCDYPVVTVYWAANGLVTLGFGTIGAARDQLRKVGWSV